VNAVSDRNVLSLTASVWSRVSRLHRARRRAARPPTCLPEPPSLARYAARSVASLRRVGGQGGPSPAFTRHEQRLPRPRA